MLCAIESALTPGNSEGVMSATCHSQQPCSAPVDSGLWLLLWSQSVSHLAFLFFCCLLLSPALLSFPRNPTFSPCARSTIKELRFCHLATSNILVLICSRTHLFVFLVAQGIHRAFLQCHISNESFFFPY